MTDRSKTKETRYYWTIAETNLARDGTDEGSLMGFPCLRVNGDFFSACEHRTGDLIVKLPRERVTALILAERGEAFAPRVKCLRNGCGSRAATAKLGSL